MATSQTTDPKRIPDWDAPDDHAPERAGVGWVVAGGGGYVAILVVLAAVIRQPIGTLAWLVCGAVAVFWGMKFATGEGERLLEGARRAEPGSRLVRLAEGLSGDIGIRPPELWTYDGAPINAFITRRKGHPAVCVSSELVSGYGLTELEAVVAHCLVRSKTGVPIPPWARWMPGWTKRVPPCAARAYDIKTAALTRYPPALASALRKAGPRDGRDQGVWFVPRASGECAAEARADALEDL
jgi:hypothetical protein